MDSLFRMMSNLLLTKFVVSEGPQNIALDPQKRQIIGWMRYIKFPFAYVPKVKVEEEEFYVQDYLYCTLCQKWISRSTTTSNWNRHCERCSGKQKNLELNQVFERFFFSNALPFLLIEDTDLNELFPSLPCRQVLARHLHEIAYRTNEAIKTIINSSSDLSISLDEWSDASNRRYVGFTILIFNNWIIEKVDLPLQIIRTIRLGSIEIYQLFENIVIEYNLKEKVRSVSTDTCNTMKAFSRIIKNHGLLWQPCICHCLDLLIETFMNASNEALEDVFMFHNKWVRSTPFVAFLQQTECPLKKIPRDSNTRWTSYSRVINALIIVFPYIHAFCMICDHELPNTFLLIKLECIQSLFNKYEKAIMDLQSENFGTISKILYHIQTISTEIRKLPDFLNNGKVSFEQKLQNMMTEYNFEWVPFLYIACYLNPMYDWVNIMGEMKLNQVKEWIAQRAQSIQINREETTDYNDNYLRHPERSMRGISWEMQSYELYSSLITNSELGDFWKNGNAFPTLQIIAREILTIQVTSSPTERLFSCSSNVIGAKRTKMSSETLRDATLIRSNPKISKQILRGK